MSGSSETPVYVPGACNIGTEEVTARRRAALAAAGATLVLGGLLVASGAPRESRFLVGVPAAMAAVSWLQVRNSFCVAYAARGVYNVAQPLGMASPVADAAARGADRRRALRMIAGGVAVGVLVAAGLFLVP